jgi:hypothetical protein
MTNSRYFSSGQIPRQEEIFVAVNAWMTSISPVRSKRPGRKKVIVAGVINDVCTKLAPGQ